MIKNITQITRNYIFARPPIRECIARGIINNSALARLICKENSINKFDAVHAACKRFEKDSTTSFNRKVEILINSGEIHISHNISLIKIHRPRNTDKLLQIKKEITKKKGRFDIYDSGKSIQIIASAKFSKEIKNSLSSYFIESFDFLSQLTLILDNDGIRVPGILTHVFSLLSYHGINIVGEICFSADIRIFINKDDVSKAISIIAK